MSKRAVVQRRLSSEWLRETLHQNHPLFNQRVWTSGILDRLENENKVLTGTMFNEVSGMSATGVPPHIILANEIADLRQEVRDKFVSIEENIGGALEK